MIDIYFLWNLEVQVQCGSKVSPGEAPSFWLLVGCPALCSQCKSFTQALCGLFSLWNGKEYVLLGSTVIAMTEGHLTFQKTHKDALLNIHGIMAPCRQLPQPYLP